MTRRSVRKVLEKGVVLLAAAVLAVLLLPAVALAAFEENPADKPGGDVTALAADVSQQVSINNSNKVAWLKFTPEETDTYRVILKTYSFAYDVQGGYIALYKESPRSDSMLSLIEARPYAFAGSDVWCIGQELTAGETYYIACSTQRDSQYDITSTMDVAVVTYDPYSITEAWYWSGLNSTPSFLVGMPVDLDAAGIYALPGRPDASTYSNRLTIGNGLQVACYYSIDPNTGDCTQLGPNTPTAAGEYRAEIVASDPAYHGSKFSDFVITDDISSYNVGLEHHYFWADGSPLTPAKLGKHSLYSPLSGSRVVADPSFCAFAYWADGDGNKLESAPSKPGYYYAVFEGRNGCKGKTDQTIYVIDPHDVSSYTLTRNGEPMGDSGPFGPSSSIYALRTGSPVTLDTLGIELVRYAYPIDPYSGGRPTGSPTATLKYGTDYQAKWFKMSSDINADSFTLDPEELTGPPTERGTYKVELTGIAPYDDSKTFTFAIADDTDMPACTVSNVKRAYAFEGKPITLAPKVTSLGGHALVEGRDYTVAVRDEDGNLVEGLALAEPGEYSLVISGMGSYKGDYSMFIYVAISQDVAAAGLELGGIEDSYAYTGQPIQPVPTLISEGDELPIDYFVDSSEYTITYTNNVRGPVATVAVTFNGLLKGTLTKTFKITGAPAVAPVPAPAPAAKAKSVTVNAKKVSAKVIASAMKKAGTDAATVKTITLGKNVKAISAKAFAKCKKATTLVVKSKKLTKKSVKGSLKGSKVKTVQVKVGKKKVNKKFVKKYKKIFTKKNCGKKVKVK